MATLSRSRPPGASGGGDKPPDRNRKPLPSGHYAEGYDDELMLRLIRDIGIRDKDIICPNCHYETDEQHRRDWRNCPQPCPACPRNQQHRGNFCPHLVRLSRNPSYWRSHMDCEVPRASTGQDAPAARNALQLPAAVLAARDSIARGVAMPRRNSNRNRNRNRVRIRGRSMSPQDDNNRSYRERHSPTEESRDTDVPEFESTSSSVSDQRVQHLEQALLQQHQVFLQQQQQIQQLQQLQQQLTGLT